ncbi:MAG: cytochrome c class [Gemmatimonadales bacterium]|nr:cytochrome c class [Gemmatimonadales bacterium]
MRSQRYHTPGLRECAIAAICAVSVASACSPGGGSRSDTSTAKAPDTAGQPAVSHLLVAGDSLRFVQHDEILAVGFPASTKPLQVKNPYEGDKAAISTGGKLFIAYNCLDCHGADGSGAMGPSFQDGRWHFGGGPGEVFESIYQGRPDGMPAWGGRISNDQIWMLTAYVRSLSSKDLSTENFTGKTIERTGH